MFGNSTKRQYRGSPARATARRFVAALLLLRAATAFAGEQPSDRPPIEILLLQMSPGHDLFARFGHAALAVKRGEREGVYNFGYTERFGDRSLVLDFLRGEAFFFVAVTRMRGTLAIYRDEGRQVSAYPLRLQRAQAQQLAEALEQANRPENRYYVYHHFDDNCATRLRDLINTVLAGQLEEALATRQLKTTYRDHVRRGFAGQTGILLLAELLLGRRVDRQLDAYRAMFLPELLTSGLQQANLLGSGQILLPASAPAPSGDPLAGLKLLWSVATVLSVGCLLQLLFGRAARRGLAPLRALAFLCFGLLALLLWSLACYTTLPELRFNELVLLFWPTDLLLVGNALRSRARRFVARPWSTRYCWLRLASIALIGCGQLSGLLVQQPRVLLLLAAAAFFAQLLANLANQPSGSIRPR
ncbi:MAG: DUF4105 domain-containing protein [Deltaproteobacteria bacterium]|nr:DUF4105 domain-containing protein [Deltaproteobacteria bacterium]